MKDVAWIVLGYLPVGIWIAYMCDAIGTLGPERTTLLRRMKNFEETKCFEYSIDATTCKWTYFHVEYDRQLDFEHPCTTVNIQPGTTSEHPCWYFNDLVRVDWTIPKELDIVSDKLGWMVAKFVIGLLLLLLLGTCLTLNQWKRLCSWRGSI
jgi:hypothetical protein